MFTRRFHLFTLLGFRVGLDLSWFLLAILLVWSLSAGYFPGVVPGLATGTYLWMGVIGALGLFASIVFHEFAHAMVARRFQLPIGGITLFIFGGIAELEDEPATPQSEFLVAIAGPIASFVLSGAFYALSPLIGGSPVLAAVIGYLALINLVLGIFNLLPAFPLDGGRILRSSLWWFNGDLRKSTRIAGNLGIFLGAALMVLGVINIVSGAFVAGMWQLLIGFFIQSAAGASRSQAELREGLKNVRVGDVMKRDVITAPPDLTIAALVDDYFYRHYHKLFPVLDARGALLGCVRLTGVRGVPKDRWPTTRVDAIMERPGKGNVLAPHETAIEAMKRMRQGGASRFMVVQGGRLVGVLTLRDILDALAVRLQLEEGVTAAGAEEEALIGGFER